MNAILQSFYLLKLADSTEDHGMAEIQKATIGLDAVPDLCREFTGGGKDERTRGSLPRSAGIAGKPLQERQDNLCRLLLGQKFAVCGDKMQAQGGDETAIFFCLFKRRARATSCEMFIPPVSSDRKSVV